MDTKAWRPRAPVGVTGLFYFLQPWGLIGWAIHVADSFDSEILGLQFITFSIFGLIKPQSRISFNEEIFMDGRTKKFNKETWTIIVETVRIGMSQARAAQSAGISESTLYDWINKALNEPEKYPEHAEFYEALLVADADCERTLVQKLHEAAEVHWKAALEILKARFPKDWGKQVVA